jgi:hypothetical protein
VEPEGEKKISTPLRPYLLGRKPPVSITSIVGWDLQEGNKNKHFLEPEIEAKPLSSYSVILPTYFEINIFLLIHEWHFKFGRFFDRASQYIYLSI